MKKAIAFPLLLLANIVILAHAIVPHHHHDKIVVAIGNFLSIDEKLDHDHHAYNHHHNSDDHEHDGESDEDCLLNELFIRSGSNQSLSSAQSNDTDFDFHAGIPVLYCDVISQIEIQDYGNLPFRQKPYLTSSYNHFVTHSLGLRAPPSC